MTTFVPDNSFQYLFFPLIPHTNQDLYFSIDPQFVTQNWQIKKFKRPLLRVWLSAFRIPKLLFLGNLDGSASKDCSEYI